MYDRMTVCHLHKIDVHRLPELIGYEFSGLALIRLVAVSYIVVCIVVSWVGDCLKVQVWID